MLTEPWVWLSTEINSVGKQDQFQVITGARAWTTWSIPTHNRTWRVTPGEEGGVKERRKEGEKDRMGERKRGRGKESDLTDRGTVCCPEIGSNKLKIGTLRFPFDFFFFKFKFK